MDASLHEMGAGDGATGGKSSIRYIVPEARQSEEKEFNSIDSDLSYLAMFLALNGQNRFEAAKLSRKLYRATNIKLKLAAKAMSRCLLWHAGPVGLVRRCGMS